MYKSILLPIDLDHKSSWEKAFPEAVRMALNHKAQLHVMTVVPDFGMAIVGSYFPEGFENKVVADVTKKLRDLAEEYVPDGMKVKLHISIGTIYDKIITKAKKVDAELIVMASHKPAAHDYLLGQNAARVVRHAEQSVLVVRN